MTALDLTPAAGAAPRGRRIARHAAMESALTLRNGEIADATLTAWGYTSKTLVAYAVGALLAPTTLVVHFEKGDTALRGVYQAINQTFVRHHARFPVSLVNREEDLGDPGLRQAKLSYRPVDFVRKERIALRPALCPMDTAPGLSSCGEEVFSPH